MNQCLGQLLRLLFGSGLEVQVLEAGRPVRGVLCLAGTQKVRLRVGGTTRNRDGRSIQGVQEEQKKDSVADRWIWMWKVGQLNLNVTFSMLGDWEDLSLLTANA